MLDAARLGTTQTVAYTGTAAATTNAFAAGTRQIRVTANSACHVAISGSPTATVSSAYLPAGAVEYFTVNPGEKISAIRAATAGLDTATSGTLWVTEMS